MARMKKVEVPNAPDAELIRTQLNHRSVSAFEIGQCAKDSPGRGVGVIGNRYSEYLRPRSIECIDDGLSP